MNSILKLAGLVVSSMIASAVIIAVPELVAVFAIGGFVGLVAVKACGIV